MDATDVRVFCELAFKETGFSPPGERELTPAAISRKLGLDEKTVRGRIRRMEETGFIKYYQATPDLGLFGLKHLEVCRFEAMNVATKVGAVRYAEALPGIVELVDYLGPTFSVSIASGSKERAEQLTGEIAGHFELRRENLGSAPIAEPKSKPDRLDWQLIGRLRYDARSSYKDVAEGLSISQRLAQYRIRKITNAGALRVRAVINPQKQEGLVFYELAVAIEPERKGAIVRAAREQRRDQLWAIRELPGDVLLLSFFSFTLAEPEEVAIDLLAVAGVRWCSILIVKEVIEPPRPNWIDRLIGQKVLEARAAASSGKGTRPGPTRT